jgi:hypothetical protein
MYDVLMDQLGWIVICLIFYLPITIYLVNRILKNKYFSSKKKKVYLILTCFMPLIILLLYSIESNRALKKRYSPKSKDNNSIVA